MNRILLLLLVLFPIFGRAQEPKPKIVDNILELIRLNYVDAVDSAKLRTIADRDGLAAVFKELDPHSQYLSPDAYKEMSVNTAGTFAGIGMTLQEADGGISVVGTLPGTPAYRAGVMPGEKLVAVDGGDIAGITLQAVVKKLRGQPGTSVRIALASDGIEQPREITLTREVIKVGSARGRLLGADIGYLQIPQFRPTTTEDARAVLENLKSQGMRRLIIDLRNNPGGLLSSVIDFGSLFLDSGKLIAYIQGQDASSRKDFNSSRIGLFADLPLVLVVNGGTSAGPEILTGALQDYERGLVVGSRTFGRGAVQTLWPLPDGGALKLTTARYRTPKGRMIDRGTSSVAGGFIPDVVAEASPDEEKTSREYLESLLRSGTLIESVEANREPVLAKALETLQRGSAPPAAAPPVAAKPRAEIAPAPAKVEADESLPAPVEQKPDALAVIFGIENYKKVGGVSFARRDAESFKRYAVDLLGVPDSKNHIYFLTEDVTLAEFKKAFGANGWLARRVKPTSDVYFYYAGHGAPDLDSKRGFLVPEDGDPNYAGETGYPIDDLYKFLDGLKARSVSVFLDSCFSGADRENKMLLAQARPLVMSVLPPAKAKNIVVFSAASGSQISSGFPEKQHGLFTYYLLKGLRGDASKTGGRRVTAGELEEYLKAKVGDAAAGMDREQVPQLNGDPARVIIGGKR